MSGRILFIYICLISYDHDDDDDHDNDDHDDDGDVPTHPHRVILAGDSVAPIDPSTAKEKHTANRNHLKNAVSPSKQVIIT